MNKNLFSNRLFRIVMLAALVIPLALSAVSSPAKASAYGVFAWGLNAPAVNDIPDGLTDVIAVAGGGSHSLALKSDGTVIGWGDNLYGQSSPPPDLTEVTKIDAGNRHSLALKSDGTVVAWGSDYYGEIDVPAGLTGVTAIAAGAHHNLALKSDGTVVAWGDNFYGQTNVPSGLTNVVAIGAGYLNSLAVKSDGTVVAWGSNTDGESTVPPGLTDVVAVDAGAVHSLALKSDGTVVAWGNNNVGQTDVPPGLTNVIAIASGLYYSIALKADGTVVGWGIDGGGYDVPSGLMNVASISAGETHFLARVPANMPGNTAPTANPGGPYLGAVNTAITFDGSLSSDPENDPLTYVWTFGDNSTGTGAAPAHTYTAPGLYDVCLMVNDGSLTSESACTLAVVYDPSAGFVTGGGWITSPEGAYPADPTLTGKATFGFMAKYQKGTTVPTGTTAFQFDLAGMAFASQSYEWLVVNQAGSNAQFKGSGLINGAGDENGNAYKFMLWAGDGTPDTFRIKIWWKDAAGEHVMYDNGVDQAIGGGNIVVHTSK